MNISSYTTPGKRENNEDVLVAEKRKNCIVLAVADGMGGHAGGGEASQIVADIIGIQFNQFCQNPSHDKIKVYLNDIVQESQLAIQEKGERTEGLKGLGTTLTILLGYKDKFVIGNIGDSRAYVIYNDTIKQITEDHTYYSQYKRMNPDKKIDKKMKERYSKILTKCIDGKGNECDIFPEDQEFYELNDDEVILLCSDGLIIDNESNEDDLKSIVETSQNLQEASADLIDYAYKNGSEDNISVVLTTKDQTLDEQNVEQTGNKEETEGFIKKLEYYKPALSFLLTSLLILFLLMFAIFKLMNTLGENYNKKDKGSEEKKIRYVLNNIKGLH